MNREQRIKAAEETLAVLAKGSDQNGPHSLAFKSVTFAIAGLKNDTNIAAFKETFENGND